MPTTTRQLAKIAAISEGTVRNYTRDYAELLSPAGRGDVGSRLFSDDDVQIICTIATLRKEDVPRAEIMERLQRGDIIVDPATRPQQATTSPQEGQGAQLATIDVLPMALARFEAIERRLDAQERADVLWHIGTGIWIGIVFSGLLLWVLWLVAGA